MKKWYAFLADHYKKHTADRGFMVQDYPYHLIMAGHLDRYLLFELLDTFYQYFVPKIVVTLF